MRMKHDPIMVFDLDGVITHPSDSSVDPDAVQHIHNLLEQGRFVAVNTGRSYQWVETNLLHTLESLGSSAAFDHLFVACEKGGESVKWIDGTFVPQPSRFALTEEVRDQCRQLFESNKARMGTMFWDTTKQTMATIEKLPEADLAQFKQEREFLVARLRETFAGQDVKVDATTVATDIESPHAGKHAGAELVYEWVAGHLGTENLEFISFGDSKSDYEMARHFAQKGCTSSFVFVGDKTVAFEEDPGVTLLRTDTTYAHGTREYFDKQ